MREELDLVANDPNLIKDLEIVGENDNNTMVIIIAPQELHI